MISHFEEELKCADSDYVSEISSSASSSATHDDSDDSDYGEGTSLQKNSKRKKPPAKNKQSNKPVQRRRCGTGTKPLTRKRTAAKINIGKQQR